MKRNKLKVYWKVIRLNIPFLPVFFYNLVLALLVKRQRFFDTIPGSEILEQKWKVIQKELQQVLKKKESIPAFQEVDSGQERISDDQRWKTFFLMMYGNKVEKNCQQCPETTRLLGRVPGVYTAMFSILDGKKHIPKHYGPFRGVIRYHLGLLIPPGRQASIRVGGQTRYWEEGKSLIFDDTYLHEVWNNSEQERVVLFLDIERPMPYKWLQKLNRRVMNHLQKANRVKTALGKA